MRNGLYLILLLLICKSGDLLSQDISVNLNPKIHYLITSQTLSFEEALIRYEKGEFKLHNSDQPVNYGYDNREFWFYTEWTTLYNGEYVIRQPYPYHHFIDFHKYSMGEWFTCETGNLRPFNSRGSLEPESFAWPFHAHKGDTLKFIFKITSKAPIMFGLSMQNAEMYTKSSNRRSLLYGMFFGILIVMFLYNFFIYIIVRDRVYIYYLILVLTNALVFASVSGYAFHYLHPDYPAINYSVREALIAFITIPTALFSISFLNLKRYFKLGYYILLVMMAMSAIVITLIIFGYIHGLSSKLITVHAPMLLIVGIISRLRGNKLANIYILAWIGYISGGLAMTLRNRGILPATFLTDHGAEIGVVLDIFLLAIALAYRYRKIRHERAELQKQNIELIEKQNIILEKRVKDRTRMLDSTLRMVQKQHDDLVLKNGEMHSSMTYALRIQESIFPDKARMMKSFEQVSIFHTPKQTVSGDFMFYESTDHYDVLALVDCTGHGVPGALLSMIGYNLLYDAVNVEQLHSPRMILNYLELNFKTRLNQEAKAFKDGMEVAICLIDKKNSNLIFSGARRPILICMENGGMKFFRGSKRAIGGHLENVDSTYDEFECRLSSGDAIYLFSDGYQDQFGGIRGKKFMSKNLRSLLKEISKLNGDTQEEKLAGVFHAWKGDEEQVDDVLVVGVKI